MKTLLKALGVVAGCLILVLVILSITGLDPHERRPGLWLKGNLVTTPVTDWSFTDAYPTVKIQTQSSYLLPHSVTILCIAYNGQLYVASVYPAGGPNHSWNENIMRDPHVRIKIGDQVYDRTVSVVSDPAEKESVMEARGKKYPQLKVPENPSIHIFHVVG